MFFELHDSKNEIIKSISIDTSKLDESVREHLNESLKGRIKIVDNKLIIKTNIIHNVLKDINDDYIEFHSKFIIDNVINNPTRIKE